MKCLNYNVHLHYIYTGLSEPSWKLRWNNHKQILKQTQKLTEQQPAFPSMCKN